MGHGPHSCKLVVICVVLLLFVLFYILFVCKCVLYYCHQVTTQLRLTNISYHISYRNIQVSMDSAAKSASYPVCKSNPVTGLVVAQREGRGIALPFQDLSARRG